MNYCRIADPPEHLEKEAERIAEQFFAQFSDDELIPDDAYSNYLREHGSAELVRYLNSIGETEDTEDLEKELV